MSHLNSLQILGVVGSFFIAMIYSSAGFGGGSSYLSIMAMINLPFRIYPVLALICNLFVVFGSIINYIRNKLIHFKDIFPWILCSIPGAYFGSKIIFKEKTFLLVLGILLFVSGVRIILNEIVTNKSITSLTLQSKVKFIIGGIIGFISGIVGIGGGIFLSPLLNYIKADTAKKIAITTTVFIFVNSISSLVGKIQNLEDPKDLIMFWPFVFAVILGGQIGNRWCIFKASERQVRLLSGVLAVSASISLFLKIV